MGFITIKQPGMYFSYDLPDEVEPYDRTLIMCKCNRRLMESGIGLCDNCIDEESLKMQSDLEEMFQ